MRTDYKKWIIRLVIIVLAAGSFLLWQGRNNTLPEHILFGNGRIEGDDISIATKFAGRIEKILVEEGDEVTKDQLLIVMDSKSLKAAHKAALAREVKVGRDIKSAEAAIHGCKSDLKLQEVELKRSKKLAEKKFVSQQRVDQYQMRRDTAEARLEAAEAKKLATEAALDAACASSDEILVNLKEMEIHAPRSGRILYKLAEVGEVLASGGRILQLVDLDHLYMTVYLPEQQAGKVTVGSEARIRVDALPDHVFPATISYIADEAEFTPKEVQTTEERQKLVFRAKLRIKNNAERLLKPGMPGDGYVNIRPEMPWPETLQ